MARKYPVPKVGDEVRIEFKDHLKNGDGFIDDYTYGRVAIVHKSGRVFEGLTVDVWTPKIPFPITERDSERENFDSYTIHAGAIRDIIIVDFELIKKLLAEGVDLHAFLETITPSP